MPLIHDETDEKGGDITVHPQSSVPSWDPLNVGLAAGKGAVKELIQNVESIPGIGSMPKEGPVMSWAGSKNEEHPNAEAVGRFAGDVAPMALIPELGVAGGIARTANAAKMLQPYYRYGIPRVASQLDRIANWVTRGAIGGASQAPQDRGTGARVGAEAGVGAGALRSALMSARRFHPLSLPGLAAALAAAAWYEKGRINPYLAFHTGQIIPAAASTVAPFFPSGVAGAIGERAAQATGYDRANQPPPKPPEDSDEIVNEK